MREEFQWQEETLDFPARYGVRHVRGAEVFEVRDESDVILNDPTRCVRVSVCVCAVNADICSICIYNIYTHI
jgi:hypothetical protein